MYHCIISSCINSEQVYGGKWDNSDKMIHLEGINMIEIPKGELRCKKITVININILVIILIGRKVFY